MSKLGLWKAIFFFCVLCLAAAIGSPAQTFTTLVNFDGTNGTTPFGSLVQGTDGNLYGTTAAGGTNNQGTVFKMAAGGELTTLYNFCTQTNCTDGLMPNAGLLQAADGNFYGTTVEGGANGCGTVFKITPGGTFTKLWDFCSQPDCADGAFPRFGPLVQGTDGNLYGTTSGGGANGGGTVFKITIEGALTTLHPFCSMTGCADGGGPFAGLVQAGNGNFYGTTGGGGANDDGTVFEITSTGQFTLLYSFCSLPNCTDGNTPTAGLTQASNKNLYGTTFFGGANNAGEFFEITPAGAFTPLYSFCSQANCADGYGPYATPVQATDGNLYGTTGFGGSPCAWPGCGVVYEITPAGILTTLHSFDGTDGSTPASYGLFQATNGELYGTTNGGGANGDGTVFSLSVGLGPFVQTEPTSGAVGTIVTILGSNLTGATRVTFNGTAATFQVISSSEILTVVPTGATTGVVQVTTPSGTLDSNPAFQVTTQQNAPPVRIASLQETVEALVTAGTINATQGQSLLTPLSDALTELGEGHTPAAIRDLLTFADRVALLTFTGALRAAAGQVLIDAALLIIVGLV